MGNLWSFAQPEPPPTVVLVPPLIDSRDRGRSRFAKSTYDRLFSQPQLRILFADFLPSDCRGALRFTPPQDPRISVVAKLATGSPLAPRTSSNISSDTDDETSFARVQARNRTASDAGEGRVEGKITLRYQPNPAMPWNFIDLKARTTKIENTPVAAIRACYLNPTANTAVFAHLPLSGHELGVPLTNLLRVGMRYTSPVVSAGIITNPIHGMVHTTWLCGRVGPLLWGVQTTPNIKFDVVHKAVSTSSSSDQRVTFNDIRASIENNVSWGVAYQPQGQSAHGRGVFTAAVEVRRKRELAVSFLHHMAVQRNVRNPFEKTDVVGITNYLDIAFQMVTDLGDASDAVMRLGAAWQANKNVAVKSRLDLNGAAMGVILKSWWQPAFTLGFSVQKTFDGRPMRLGMTATVESFDKLRYERSAEGQKMSGARITQRHVASEEDVAYHEGRGLLIPLSEVDNPVVLGQQAPIGSQFL